MRTPEDEVYAGIEAKRRWFKDAFLSMLEVFAWTHWLLWAYLLYRMLT